MVFALVCRMGRFQIAGLVAGAAVAASLAGPAGAADRRAAMTPTGLPATTAPSGAELVGKLLNEQTRASDPDVPLPQPNLSPHEPIPGALSGPSLYGRPEDGGAVVGLKFPIPVSRTAQ